MPKKLVPTPKRSSRKTTTVTEPKPVLVEFDPETMRLLKACAVMHDTTPEEIVRLAVARAHREDFGAENALKSATNQSLALISLLSRMDTDPMNNDKVDFLDSGILDLGAHVTSTLMAACDQICHELETARRSSVAALATRNGAAS